MGLVGTNGSGKTTLFDLVAGLLTPTAGKVQIDGIEINDANRAAWRARIAYVPQNIFLLDASVAQNIAFGIPPDAIDTQRLIEAARMAQLETLIEVPGGFNHRVGERGVALSGGQRQRIGIARALYRDRAVLLLDEATSALDEDERDGAHGSARRAARAVHGHSDCPRAASRALVRCCFRAREREGPWLRISSSSDCRWIGGSEPAGDASVTKRPRVERS